MHSGMEEFAPHTFLLEIWCDTPYDRNRPPNSFLIRLHGFLVASFAPRSTFPASEIMQHLL